MGAVKAQALDLRAWAVCLITASTNRAELQNALMKATSSSGYFESKKFIITDSILTVQEDELRIYKNYILVGRLLFCRSEALANRQKRTLMNRPSEGMADALELSKRINLINGILVT